MKTLVCPDVECGCRDIERITGYLFVCCKCDTYFVAGPFEKTEIVDARDIPFDPEYGIGIER